MPMRSLYHKSKKAVTASELEEAKKLPVKPAVSKKKPAAKKKEDK